MFADPALGESESRAVFVDPSTGNVTGDLTVYGTSGALPLRTWLSNLHRSLLLGEPGRVYSELAASWLWVLALSGAGLWLARWQRTKPERRRRTLVLPEAGELNAYRRTLNRHSAAGIWLALSFLFLSATGLTWSARAGANVAELRTVLGWTTPTLDTALQSGDGTGAAGGHEGHSGHAGHTMATPTAGAEYDGVLAVARDAGIDSSLVEIAPPAADGQAWSVTEVDRSWPTQADSVAVDPTTDRVVNEVRFQDYGLAAKLTRWGIDAHMGLLFGLVNQVVLFVVALGLAAMTVWGYLMWWRRRPGFGAGRAPVRGALRRTPWWVVVGLAVTTVAVGMFLPLLGISLLCFLGVDVVVGVILRMARRRGTRQLA
nr:PepSY-associated TM helix domain-containing protein [Kocuria sp. JC486]